ncbi:hypothetical protein PHYBLDRAFT_145885 [Phycomyces blakesleeanus NRRL 1555(-)]|uniref:Uncharacterized protein n=1 Tax=Phycomyces blakesleeanus (strain ATCC 8743b / DSM 1359 / FGSC 10004 / NBRC 33097 / NRRL 1555) TaxID=763407 RepID=A0A167MPZ9_PHYB8|nr:hypothetical protein PHYBLDRAFT_145885 [Phycomyces blakesleeanus NRRL 1555(-)]OAD73494.1 hypothetical protein PHYBLDRAFT_145885 [Phycomyces blakesleeanus NRRL 1555(-)]|eukprot:XP_018291534.1 hypothetical protein PHYBLDRAFT_145885 [Phycomyces blakesleeanus NRRL 1555(-)]
MTAWDNTSMSSSYQQSIKQLAFRKTMEANLALSIKDILVPFREDEINSLEAQLRLLSLARTIEGPQQNIVRAIESLIPSWKDVDMEPLSKGHIIASYTHPLIQSLLAVNNPSNTKIVADNINQRPDYVVDVYEQYQFSFPSCFGEKYKLNGVLSFQTIGSFTTFFHLKQLAGIDVFCEMTSITIPTRKQDIVQIVAYLDDLFAISCLHNNILKSNEELTVQNEPILPLAWVDGTKEKTSLKRKISVNSIAGAQAKR